MDFEAITLVPLHLEGINLMLVVKLWTPILTKEVSSLVKVTVRSLFDNIELQQVKDLGFRV